jgi:hypothetical protein
VLPRAQERDRLVAEVDEEPREALERLRDLRDEDDPHPRSK